MKWTKLIFLILYLSWSFKEPVTAQESASQQITATIKISICGNGIIEEGEDCEGKDLNGQTCLSRGYAGGTLSCDIACAFDTYGCLTSTLASIPTAELTSTPTPAPVIETPTPTSVSTLPVIPAVVAIFDIDGSGRIEITEVFTAVKSWVDEWREALKEEIAIARGEVAPGATPRRTEKCDLNRDQRCDLIDFSILLYYIGR